MLPKERDENMERPLNAERNDKKERVDRTDSMEKADDILIEEKGEYMDLWEGKRSGNTSTL